MALARQLRCLNCCTDSKSCAVIRGPTRCNQARCSGVTDEDINLKDDLLVSPCEENDA